MLARTHTHGNCGRSNVWVLVAGSAVLLALIAWLVFSESNKEIAAVVTPSTDERSAGDDGGRAALAEVEEGARSVAPELETHATTDATAAAEAAVQESLNELRGRVVAQDDGPIAGAEVSLRRGDLRAFSVLDLELARSSETIATATTDESGEFRFELARGIPVDVHVEAADFAPAEVLARHAGEFVTVRMTAGVRVFGRVTRAADLAPVADARVRAHFSVAGKRLERTTLTAGNGTYELLLPHCKSVTLEVIPLVERCPPWANVTIGEDGRAEQNFAVEDGTTITGRVTSAASGSPIAGASVGEGWVFRRTAVTDANGEYRMPGFGDSGLDELHVRADGFGVANKSLQNVALDAEVRVDFQLTPARRAHGRVVDESGAPLEGVLACGVGTEFDDEGQRTDWVSARTDAAGRFALENLTHDLRHVLMLSHHGYATSVYDFPLDELSEADLDLGEFVLGPPALVAGVVEDDAGTGLQNVVIVLNGSNTDRDRLLGGQKRDSYSLTDSYTNTRQTSSNAQGRFSFGDVAPGTYTLGTKVPGRTSAPPLELTVAQGESVEDLRLVLSSGARARGRVVDPDGAPVAGVYVQAHRSEHRNTLMGGGAALNTARTNADGRFDFQGLADGEYDLSVSLPESQALDNDAPLLPARLEGVRTNSGDIEIVLPRGTTIRGTLHDATGKPLAGHGISVKAEHGANFCQTDANGAFRLPVEAGRVYDLLVSAPHENGSMRVVHTEVRIVAGAHGVEIVLP